MDNTNTDMYIANNCHIKGGITSSGNVTIDGQVEGNIVIEGDLVIGHEANVKADIEAMNVHIKGEVQGKITAKSLLEMSSTGRLNGDIHTKYLKIDQGARFVGTSMHPDEEQSESGQNDSKFGFKPTVYNRLAK